MKTILFLTQRIPYPPNKGDKLRAYQVLNHWAQRHKVLLGCFVDDAEDWRHTSLLRERCAGAYFARLHPKIALARAAGALLTNKPFSVPYYRNRGLAAWVRQMLTSERPERAFLFSSVMAQYLLGAAPRPERVLMDFVDVDSEKWAEYAATKPFPGGMIYHREARKLASFDRAVARDTDASIFVSEPEAALFRKRAPEVRAKVHVVPNGIDSIYFSPENRGANLDLDGTPVVAFTGHMDYWPNVDAVEWFSEDILPKLRARYPGIKFLIVGAHPSRSVQELGKSRGITVTGAVPDVRPYLAYADVVVAPMRISRGIQNKVLEGMAMARPVIVTPQALEGIDAVPNRHVLVARNGEEMVSAVARALDPAVAKAVGAAARQRVLERYTWASSLALYDQLLEA